MSQPRTVRKPPLPPEASRTVPSTRTEPRAPEAASPPDSEIKRGTQRSPIPAPTKSFSGALQSPRPLHRVIRGNPLDTSTRDEKTNESALSASGRATSNSAVKSTASARTTSKITGTTADLRRPTGTIATGVNKQPAVVREGQGNRSSPQAKPSGKPIKSVVDRAAGNSAAPSSSTSPGKKQKMPPPRTTTSVRVKPPSRNAPGGRPSKQSEPVMSSGPLSGSRAVKPNIGSTSIRSNMTSRPPSAIPSTTNSRPSSSMNYKATPETKQAQIPSTGSHPAQAHIVPVSTNALDKRMEPVCADTARKLHRSPPPPPNVAAKRGSSSSQRHLRQDFSKPSQLPRQSEGREIAIAFKLGDRSRLTTASGNVGCGNKVEINNYHGDEREIRKKRIHEALQNRLALHDVDRVPAEKDLCYEGTRVDIIGTILEWAQTTTPDSTVTKESEMRHQCLCITGVPGSGKSTLSATLAQKLEDDPEHHLYAHFIISRGVDKFAQPNNIFPTIAYQLALRSDDAAQIIEASLDQKPSIVRRLSAEQGTMLFLEPLRTISRSSRMAIVIIDALDELNNESSSSFISILANMVQALPLNVKIILSSRPESDIVETLRCRVEPLELDTTESVDDVRFYLRGKLQDIVPKGEHWLNWPSKEQVDNLSRQASGLFVWAATALKFIKSQIKDNGRTCRDRVLSQLQDKGLKDLDELYGFVLRSVLLSRDDDREEKSERFRQIVGCVIVLGEPLSIEAIGAFLQISIDDFDLLRFFERLRSVLISGSGEINDRTVPQMHKSFVDYLTCGRAQTLQLHIDEKPHHSRLFPLTFQAMHDLHFNMFSLESSYVRNEDITDLPTRLQKVPEHLRYACYYWIYHMEKGLEVDEDMLAEVQSFMEVRLLAWLEVLAVSNKTAIIASAMVKLYERIKGRGDKLETFVRDAEKFIAVYLPMMRESVPHIYLSALPLSPSSSSVANHYSCRYAKTVSAPRKTVDWDPLLLSFRASADDGRGCYEWCPVAISPDDRYIASCDWPAQTIHIWDTDTGAEIRTLSVEKSRAVAFSPDGRRVISCSSQCITVLDAQTGEVVNAIRDICDPVDMRLVVTGVRQSPDGQHVLSVSLASVEGTQQGDAPFSEATIRDAADVTQLPDVGNVFTLPVVRDDVVCMIQSPDGKLLRTASTDSQIRFWDMETFQAFRDPIELKGGGPILPGPGPGFSVFSPYEHQRFASVSSGPDGSVTIWNVANGELVVGPLPNPHPGNRSAMPVAFSPDGARFANVSDSGSGYEKEIVTIHDAETGNIITRPFCGHWSKVGSIAFSLDGTRIVSTSCDRSVIVWDSYTGDIIAGPFYGHGSETVEGALFAHNRELVVSHSSQFFFICVWDIRKTGTTLIAHDTSETSVIVFRDIGFSSDGKSLLFAEGADHGGGNIMTRLDTDSYQATHRSHEISWGYYHIISPDGNHVVGMNEDRSLIQLWNANTETSVTPKLPPQLPKHSRPICFAVSPDGSFYAWVWQSSDAASDQSGNDCHLILFNVISGDTSHSVLRNGGPARNRCINVALSFDGKILLINEYDEPPSPELSPTGPRMWDSTTGQEISPKGMRNDDPTGGSSRRVLRCSPVENRFASWAYDLGDQDTCFSTWDMAGNRLKRFDGSEETTELAYSPDGKQIVSAHRHGDVRLWDVATGTLIAGPLYGHTYDDKNTVRFSPHGKQFASYEGSWERESNRTLRVWDVESVIKNAVEQKGDSAIKFRDDFKFEGSGWILGQNKELILWIPPAHRQRLWLPSNTCVIGENNLRLDWTNAVQGEEWVRCCEPLPPKNEK